MKKNILILAAILLLFSITVLPAQQLKINEFLASNDSCCADELGGFDDWVELYNAGTDPVDIGGMYITDDLTKPTLWQIPAGAPETIIPAGGFLILWCDKETEQGALHVNLKLSGGGEQIGLFEADGVTPEDTLTYEEQTTDVSAGRIIDGGVDWQLFGNHSVMGLTASPGRSNVTLKINELLAKNDNTNQDEFGNYGDWIELYNYGENDIDVTGMHMTDMVDNPLLYTFNPATVPAGGYLLIWCDGSDEDPVTSPDTLHANFKLGAGGESVRLYLNEFTVIDSTTFGAQTVDISLGRYPDGTDDWITFSLPTPGTSNTLTAGPIISQVQREPKFPEATDDVMVTAEITTNAANLTVTLKYNSGTGFTDVQMLDDGLHQDGAAGDNIWGGAIPAQAKGVQVQWYLEAADDAPSVSTFPADAPISVLAYRVTDWTPVEVIELTVNEPSGLAYNPNTGTLFTCNDGAVSDIFEISTAGELLSTIIVNGTDFEGVAFNATFDTIFVVEEAPWRIVKYTLDGTNVGEIQVSHTAGQVDGLEGIAVDPETGNIFVLHEKNSPELIELTADGQEVNRVTLTFSTDVSGISIHPVWKTLFIVSDEGFTLNEVTRTGEHLRAWYIPLDQAEGVAFGETANIIYMVADRGNKLYKFDFNFGPYTSPARLYINEFMASNDFAYADENGEFDDWIELYNPGDDPIDVGGMYVTDDLTNQTLWQIPTTAPDSTTIPAQGFLILWADKQPEQGVRHLNLKLSGGGEQIGIYGTDGLSPLDTLTYSAQTTDISYGRVPDGGANWQFFETPTPGSSNKPSAVDNRPSASDQPRDFHLSQNYPNPFNPTTTIAYYLPAAADVTVTIYNISGQRINRLVQSHQSAGLHTVSWNGKNSAKQPVTSGIYFYKLQAGEFSQIRKMLFVK